MKHNLTQHPSCQWPRHPVRGTRNPFRDRPFDLSEAFWCDAGHTK